MSFFRVIILFSLTFLLFSCASKQKKAEAEFAGESYAGVIPCADCEGIAYQINFYANSLYASNSLYIGESNKRFKEEGSWKAGKDSTIVLISEDGDTRRLKIRDDQLLMLNQRGEEVEGKLAHLYILENTRNRPLMGTVQSDSGSTIDFKAHGNEPFWGLQIDLDKMISFKIVSGDSIATHITEVEQDSASGVRTFHAEIESGSLSVELNPVGCMDSMSGQVYDYRVNVVMNNEEYSGCGDFVNKGER